MRPGTISLPLLCRLITLLLLPAVAMLVCPTRTGASGPPEIVCITCHSTLQGKYAEPVRLWRGSIHDDNGIACNSCHGGDPRDSRMAMSPERGFIGAPREVEIPAFCGRCHVGVLKEYLSSSHGMAVGKGGPTCVTCHGNHKVVKASLALFNEELCGRCHDYRRAEVIRKAMTETEQKILAIDAGISAFKQKGIATDTLEKGLFAVRNQFHTLSHTIDADRIGTESVRIQDKLKQLESDLAGINAMLSERKLMGAMAVAGALLVALLLYLLRTTYDRS